MRIISFLIIAFTLVLAGEQYHFGRGMRISKEPIFIGGYLSMKADAKAHKKELLVDELALMLYGDYEHFDFMSEFEIQDFYSKTFDKFYNYENFSTKPHIERLYANYYIDDDTVLTLGKFFSKIGFWNTWPINVLRDTTSDPNIVEFIFPEMSTGLLYKKYFNALTLYLTFQQNRDIDNRYNNFKIDHHYAFSLSFDYCDSEWRIGGGQFKTVDGNDSLYAAFGFQKDLPKWTLTIESGVRKSDNFNKILYDVYIQDVWHIYPKHDLIFRFENFRDSQKDSNKNSAVFGYTYRPKPFIAIKGEFDMRESGSGEALFSFSMMF